MLEIRGLRKAYGNRQVLRGVDLSVAPGQVMGLLGANGAGKTTLISIVAGLRRADGGTVRVVGLDALRERRRVAGHIGLAPQALGLYPTLTAARNLEFFGRMAGLRGRAVRRRVAEVADALGLTDSLGRRAEELSGGLKRRLHTGAAILHRPDVMFLDEPTVGADVQSRAGILATVLTMAAGGSAVVYTTHYLTELEQLSADVAVLHEGRIAVQGSLSDVVARYASASLALRFDGPAPSLPGWREIGNRLVPIGPVDDPGRAVAAALAELGARTDRYGPARTGDSHAEDNRTGALLGVDMARPSLETAYLAITGHQITSEETGALSA